MATCRLHLPHEKLETLKRANTFPKEDQITFDEATHTYTVNGIILPLSVTGLVHQFSSGFDARAVIAQMQARDSWEQRQHEFLRGDGALMSSQEIAERWEANGLVQRSRGTLLHYHIELHLNGALIEEPHSPEFQQFLEIERSVLPQFKIYRTELCMFHCGLGIAGQADCLCLDDDGDVVIFDWKRSKGIRTDSRQQMLPPLQHLPDCNYFQYALQLNLYRYILESEYAMRVSRMILGVMHPLRPAPLCMELPRMDDEIAAIVAHEGGQRGSGPGAASNGDLTAGRRRGIGPVAEGGEGNTPRSIYRARAKLAPHGQGSHSERRSARSEEEARDADADQEALR